MVLNDVPTLGELRDQFKTCNGDLPHPSLASTFPTVTFAIDRPTLLTAAKDGDILGYYLPSSYFASIITLEFRKTLIRLLNDLPPLRKSSVAENIRHRRRIRQSRTYICSRGCRPADILAYSRQYYEDNKQGGKANAFVEHCKPL